MSKPLIMSFRPDAAELCLCGIKTQTRRVGPYYFGVDAIRICPRKRHIRGSIGRECWTIGKPITILPGQGKKAVGQVVCTGLRLERLGDISEADAQCEGMTQLASVVWGDRWQRIPDGWLYTTARDAFEATWRNLYPSGPKSWDKNPEVVVISFRPL